MSYSKSLNNKFRHSVWYKNSGFTVKEFLDEIIHETFSSFIIVVKPKIVSDVLMAAPSFELRLVDEYNHSMRLSDDMLEYLTDNSEKYRGMIIKCLNQALERGYIKT